MTLVAHPTPIDAPLLLCVAEALESERVRYCQWKGHFKQALWMSGKGDIDLLVAPGSSPGLLEVLRVAGFIQTTSPDDYKLLGTTHYRAPDPHTGRMLHVHLHTRLLVEAARGTVYRLPFEDALIASARGGPGTLFRTPAPGLEALVLVLRTTLRWASWRRIPAETREELAYLEGLTDSRYELDALRRYLPAVAPELFRRCRVALAAGATRRERWAARSGLARALAAYARRPTLPERVVHAAAAAAWHLRGGPRHDSRARLTSGGRLFVVSGTDGSGKSTCVTALASWLRPHFRVMTAHVGRPPRSLSSLAAGALLRVAPLPVLRWAWHLALARDRCRLVARAWDFALDGGIALAERYPMAPNRALVGPRIRELAGPHPSPLARRMAALEERYYARMPRPEHVFVLDVDPDVAVRRKTDEPSDYVRARAEQMQRADWSGTKARRIDAGRPLPAVIAQLRELIWAAL
jgi:thymidylate kinase